MKNPYTILGVPKSASDEDIKKAYRALAKKFHPDLNPGNKASEATFKDISQAYEQIGSSEARAQFDRGEIDEQQQARAHERSTYYQSQQAGGRYSQSFGQGFEGADIFEELLRRGGQRTGARRPTAANPDHPGEDHFYHLDVEFKDAALGAEREITLPTGKKLLIKIPAGISSGTKLRFKGQGGPGVGSGSPGDAYVEVSTKALPGFTRVGKNIETEVPISFQEAILGAEVKVPTLEGHVMLKIPAGTNTGSRLRIRGKGIGLANARGDQIVVTKIVLPTKVDTALQDAVRGLGSQFYYDPRGQGAGV